MTWFQNKWVQYTLMGLVVLLFLSTVISTGWGDTGGGNLHVHQAQAFVQGQLHIEQNLSDTAVYQDKFYVVFPPFPAVLLTCFIAVFNEVNTTYLALLLAVVTTLALYQIGTRWLGLSRTAAAWLALALLLGTGYWYAVLRSSTVWFFSHAVAVPMLVLAMREGLVGGRGWLAGLLLGCAVLSRQVMIYAAVFVLVTLLTQAPKRRAQWRAGIGFSVGLGICMFMYLAFNAARFTGPLDTGYSYIPLQGFLKERVDTYGLFSLAYVPFNFMYMFLQGPTLDVDRMSPFGVALTYASPFVLFAPWAQGRDRCLMVAAWLSVVLALAHILLYYNNGWVQINTQRFTLDFLPILMILVGLALKNGAIRRPLLFAAIGYSITLNAYSLQNYLPTHAFGW